MIHRNSGTAAQSCVDNDPVLAQASDSPTQHEVTTNQAHVTCVASAMDLSEWKGSLTFFTGFAGTRPNREIIEASFADVSSAICPDKPQVLAEKGDADYFIPCALKEAPLIGNTLERAQKAGQSTVGKMRSKKHMTTATMLVIDGDGLPEGALNSALAAMTADGLSFLAYTTHSHGREDKPGMRVRVIVPVDHPLGDFDYRLAWHGFNARYFGGAA
jgi:hypothetical protein